MSWLVIVLAGIGLALAAAVLTRAARMPRAQGSLAEVAWRFARWMLAALLAASGAWVAIAPRADQPLLDAMERAFPAVRSAYMPDGAADDRTLGQRRARAREENRWAIAGVFVLLGASFLVSLPSRRTTPRNFEGQRGSTGP